MIDKIKWALQNINYNTGMIENEINKFAILFSSSTMIEIIIVNLI